LLATDKNDDANLLSGCINNKKLCKLSTNKDYQHIAQYFCHMFQWHKAAGIYSTVFKLRVEFNYKKRGVLGLLKWFA
jgi:hypothetical protein